MLTDTTYQLMLDSYARGELFLGGWSDQQIDAFFKRVFKR